MFYEMNLREITDDPAFDWDKRYDQKQVKELICNIYHKHKWFQIGQTSNYSDVHYTAKRLVARCRGNRKIGVDSFRTKVCSWLEGIIVGHDGSNDGCVFSVPLPSTPIVI